MFENFTDQELDVLDEALELFYCRVCDSIDRATPAAFHIYDEKETRKKDALLNSMQNAKTICLKLKQQATAEADARMDRTQGDWCAM